MRYWDLRWFLQATPSQENVEGWRRENGNWTNKHVDSQHKMSADWTNQYMKLYKRSKAAITDLEPSKENGDSTDWELVWVRIAGFGNHGFWQVFSNKVSRTIPSFHHTLNEFIICKHVKISGNDKVSLKIGSLNCFEEITWFFQKQDAHCCQQFVQILLQDTPSKNQILYGSD